MSTSTKRYERMAIAKEPLASSSFNDKINLEWTLNEMVCLDSSCPDFIGVWFFMAISATTAAGQYSLYGAASRQHDSPISGNGSNGGAGVPAD